MANKSSVFDMIGPVMIGPSSSHTAGVVRIARAAIRVLGGIPDHAEITFYNSFARTYEGHGSDRAIIGGLMDFKTDDPRIKNALDIAEENGFSYKFKSIGNSSIHHPNTIKMLLRKGEQTVLVEGESLGGGVINISEVDGFVANFSAQNHTLIIKAKDISGAIAFISSVIAQEKANIATMSVSRKGKNDLACHVIEMDSGINEITLTYLKSLPWISELIYIPDIDL
ncbi:L-serine ammonia-lyase, iron-sulfur-dependent subunit beta [Algoriphagus halophytocola]|uniref:L-serine dehydratase n=1 Tax=Algoriphagus halophytocola TaxID=2991499 RepID=A0ABY6MNP6_9BACT|nr:MULTISPECIES: L-serine ammonia-lyase, iron-sulfur-dependent subunit beta [unclassified Algoriphagus]UZD23829.1 L-serine ammonia-lyase, iron-sulfur-dependent subunit beta [Algoriphagus sp. TR-M5]WBL41196.1 L-serine ammonia-lyase, iron-sulfur-dependent subunit beta [Algoriphagus sp. TR-M9]